MGDVAILLVYVFFVGGMVIAKGLGVIRYEWIEVLFIAFSPFIVVILLSVLLVLTYYAIKLLDFFVWVVKRLG